ncbi:MAG: hypothetical protein AAGK32_08500 [Actinomycetota bacterium]
MGAPSTTAAGRWLVLVVGPLLATVLLAELGLRMLEPRLERIEEAPNGRELPAEKLNASLAALADGGTLFVGASDAGSAFTPGVVADAAGFDEAGYNGSLPGMTNDLYATWVRQVREGGGSPDRVVVGISPTRFQELGIDLSETGISFEDPVIGTIDEDNVEEVIDDQVEGFRDSVERAPQYGRALGSPGAGLALLRNRHWFQNPAEAWEALTGPDEPAAETGELELRPDGTNPAWDPSLAQAPRSRSDESVYGPIDEDELDDWVDELIRIGVDDTKVVLLPLTPHLQGVRTDPDYATATDVVVDRLCTAGIDVLDLSGLQLQTEFFSDPLHFSAAGASTVSTTTGRWLSGDGEAGACP